MRIRRKSYENSLFRFIDIKDLLLNSLIDKNFNSKILSLVNM